MGESGSAQREAILSRDDEEGSTERSPQKKLRRRFREPRQMKHFTGVGVDSPAGRRYIRATVDPAIDNPSSKDEYLYIPLQDFVDPKRIIEKLIFADLFVPLPRFMGHFLREVGDVETFQTAALSERPGWNGNSFVFKNGDLVTVSARELPSRLASADPVLGLDYSTSYDGEIVFDPATRRARTKGSTDCISKALVALQSGQDILTFCLCLGFAAPLLLWSSIEENFGFALIGSDKDGANLAAELAASIFGQPTADGELERENDLQVHLNYELSLSSDHLLILPQLDPWFTLMPEKAQLAGMRSLAESFNHSGELAAGMFPRTRLLTLTTSTVPVEDLCPDPEGAKMLLNGQLLAIGIPADRPGGVVAPTSSSLGSITAHRRAVKAEINANYGCTGRRFVRAVLIRALPDQAAFHVELDHLIDDFVAACGVDPEDSVGIEAARRFGLVDAAARLAKGFGILPDELDTQAAILRCYRLHRGQPGAVSLAERLRKLVGAPGTLNLGKKGAPISVTDEMRDRTVVYVVHSSRKTMIYIRNGQQYDVFPDWDEVRQSAEFKTLLKRTKEKNGTNGHRQRGTTYVTLGSGRKKERVWAFVLPR